MARLTGQDYNPVPEEEAAGLGHELEKGLDENEE
jgi:hypothetical protein